MFRLSVSLSALAVAGAAHAQTAPDLTRAADSGGEVIVTANRAERPADEVAQSVTVIDAAEIQRRQSQAVLDLLRTVPGVTVTRNGGPGTVAGVNIRGAENDQNVVLIDGVKLNDPSSVGGGFNFGNLLTGNIERIEVVRGSQSVIWGSQAIGGVVNLITAAPTEELQVTARGEYGWRDTAQAVANVSGKVGPAAISVGGVYYRTDGFSAFDGGAERDGYENVGANAKLLVDLADNVSVDLRGFYSEGQTDVDGFTPTFQFGDTRERADTREFVGYGGLNVKLLDGRFRNRFAFAYTSADRQNSNPAATPRVTFDAEGENERFEYQGILDLGSVAATFGAETELSSFVNDGFGSRVDEDVRITSVYGEATVRPVAGLTLTGGVRYDDHQTFGDATTLAASGVYSPNGGATRVRAAYGEGFKAPSLFQIYGDFGNTTLRAERSDSWEVGVGQRLLEGGIELSATYFHRDTENQIDFVSCPRPLAGICVDRPFGTYDNIRLTRAEGVELGVTLRPNDRFTVIGQYSFIDAKNRQTGLNLARRPRQTVSAVVDYAFPFGLSVGSTVAHVGDSFDDGANTSRLDGYVLVDLRAAFPVTDRIELFGRVENLADEEYQTIAGYGTAGRAAFAGVRLRL